MVAPVFWNRLAYFYTGDSDLSATLRAYEYNPLINAPELKCTQSMATETSQALYHQYTMINVGEFGVIFKEQGGSTWTRYICDPDAGTWTTTNPTFIDPADPGIGTITVPSLTIVQVREDPENYASGSYPDLYAIDTSLASPYLLKVVYDDAGDTISVDVASSVAIPTEYKIITMSPAWVDVGRQHFVVLSPIDCAADEVTETVITNPSARTYTFSTTTWACDDLPASEEEGNAWNTAGTSRRRLTGRDENDVEEEYWKLHVRQDPHAASEF